MTPLLDRSLLEARLEEKLASAPDDEQPIAVLCLGIDRATDGDEYCTRTRQRLLQAIAHRLMATTRHSDLIAQLSLDTFAIVPSGLLTAAQATAVAEKLLATLAIGFNLSDKALTVAGHVGISVFPQDACTAAELVAQSEAALEICRRQRVRCYAAVGGDRRAGSLAADLREALRDDALSLYYQPQISLASGKIEGVEALLRWHHPRRGLLETASLIALAETSDLIHDLGQWVLHAACGHLKVMQATCQSPPIVAINISPLQFQQDGFVQTVENVLNVTGIDRGNLTFEITENLLIRDFERTTTALEELRALGIGIALDDFGVGYSSLSYLQRLPINTLKIDRSFVRRITSEPDDAKIVNAVIALAHDMRLRVVAEGVENVEQLRFLQARHCDWAQGFYVSRPLPGDELLSLLQGSRQLAPIEGAIETHRPHLLVVDDDPVIIAYFTAVLESHDYQVFTASCAEEGFATLARERIDVVISDYNMATMSGTEFLRRVRQLHPTAVRILVSGQGDQAILTEAINEGAIFKYLAKPITKAQLFDAVQQALSMARSINSSHAVTSLPKPVAR